MLAFDFFFFSVLEGAMGQSVSSESLDEKGESYIFSLFLSLEYVCGVVPCTVTVHDLDWNPQPSGVTFDGVGGGGSGKQGNEMSNCLELTGENARGGKGVLTIEEGFLGRQIWKELRKERPCLGVLALDIS